jgi:restriction system protein
MMAIPDYQSIMLPLLQLAADKQEHKMNEVTDALADQLELSDEERKVLIPSGTQALFYNRVGWARTYLVKAGLLETPRRGYIKITDSGLKLLAEKPKAINTKLLKRYPEFRNFQSLDPQNKPTKEPAEQTPEELIEEGYQNIRDNLAAELMTEVKNSSPQFFERLVVELLVKMGYGGSRKDAGEAIGKSGDEGIDGIIKEDRLGLDLIYIQAKRWDNTISPSEIQKFVGALHGKKANKGVFITTATFSKKAWEYASNVGTNVILIDGNQLAQLMIDFNVGVSSVSSYEIKKLDSDYFIDG